MIIGIDPGGKGGLAAYYAPLSNNGYRLINLEWDSSVVFKEFQNLINDYKGSLPTVYIENVHAMPGEGKRNVSIQSQFKFGREVGKIDMLMGAFGIEPVYVSSQSWQKIYRLPKFPTYSEKKQYHRGLAQTIFPELKVTHWSADALLIMNYAIKVESSKQEELFL